MDIRLRLGKGRRYQNGVVHQNFHTLTNNAVFPDTANIPPVEHLHSKNLPFNNSERLLPTIRS